MIKQRGLDNVTADDLVQELTPKGRAEVPPAVRVCVYYCDCTNMTAITELINDMINLLIIY